MTLINSYLRHNELFRQNGIELDNFDYHIGGLVEKLPQKLVNLIYIPLQRMAFSRYAKYNEVDIVSIHTSREFLFLKDVYLARYISRRLKKNVFLTVHVGDADTVFNRIGHWQNKLIQIINDDLIKVIFLSNGIKNQFIELGMNPQKGEVLYNFFDFNGYYFTEGVSDKDLKLLYVGAIHREKGIVELLHAVKKIVNNGYKIHLDICGQLTDSSIKDMFDCAQIELTNTITLHGYVSGISKAQLYDQADVLILPSYHEGMPLVILEAMGSRCAIVSTKVGATQEILSEDNVSWVNIGDEDAIVEAITKMCNDRSLVEKMKKRNFEKSKNFTIADHISKYCFIVNESFIDRRSSE